MMAQPVPHPTPPTTDKRRVKVYELRHNDWFDRGTGFCYACFVPVGDDQQKDPRLIVESEDQPNRRLLETRIIKDEAFQKQQDTLIVWTEDGVDMALSFQEAEGCAAIWKFIDAIQQTIHGSMGGPDDSLSDDLAIDMPPSIQLPPPDLSSLPELDMAIRNLSQTPQGRDALAKVIMNEGYIDKLALLVEMAEDLESLPDLHRLCNIMKTILLLNDASIIERAVSDECVMGVVGALEYDPEFPTHKANHRQWLSNQGRYKEVVQIQDDQVRRKIHMTYRLQYLKDVVLARILDDQTFGVLNSLIFFNQVDIVQHLHSTPGFMAKLFVIFFDKREPALRKKEAVLFIQQCCAIAKNLQPPARHSLYLNFLKQGLLVAINYGMRHRDVSVRVGATDILVSMIDHDPSMVRQTVYDQVHNKPMRLPALTETLIDLLLVEVDLGVKSQISEALKVLLDSCQPQMQQQQQGQQDARIRALSVMDPQHDAFLEHFYQHWATRLFRPLLDLEKRTSMQFSPSQEGIFSYLIDILCFYTQRHGHRCKFFVLTSNLVNRILQLLDCKEKHLQLVAVRFFRHLVMMQDDFYTKLMIDKQVAGPILDVLLRTLPRDNLLSSACLELFMLIEKASLRHLMKQIVELWRDKVNALLDFETFEKILNAYERTRGFTVNLESPQQFSDAQEDRGPLSTLKAPRGTLMEHLILDQAQEDYWNSPDDDEERAAADADAEATELEHSLAAAAAPAKPLVEYSSDDEETDENDAVMTPVDSDVPVATSSDEPKSSSPATSATALSTSPATGAANGTTSPRARSASPSVTSTSAAAAAAAAAASTPPPERVSEKRRREEDEDEDALEKLTHNSKRRNSTSSVSSQSSAGGGSNADGQPLRKKRSFIGSGASATATAAAANGGGSGGGGGAASGMKKIAISISSAVKGGLGLKTADGEGEKKSG